MYGAGIVAHNMAATFTYNRLGGVNGQKNKSLEKLSSGFRINRAADDAAGLSISESMRSRIRGLSQGNSNVNEGIGLIQTADGAMGEMTSMLQRMYTLSVQAYNGTYTDDDRSKIQEEIEELKSELTRVSETTEYNGRKLLKGSNPEDTQPFTKGLPDWLGINQNAGGAASMIKNDGLGVDQDTNLSFGVLDHNGKYTEYGAYQSDPAKKLTPTLSDNLSITFSFDGFAKKFEASASGDEETRTPDNLRKALFELLGSSVGASCATCSVGVINPKFYGVSFVGALKDPATGKEQNVELSSLKYAGGERATGNAVDLGTLTISDGSRQTISEYIDQIEADGSDPEQVNEAAQKIAERLYQATFNNLKKYCEQTDHYNRVVEVPDQSLTFAIYDFRDTDKLEHQDTPLL